MSAASDNGQSLHNKGNEIPLTSRPLTVTEKILAAITGLIVVVMFMQVFFRYVLNNSLTWSEELTRFLFIWLVFLGTVINIRDRWNIGVDVLASWLPPGFSRVLKLTDLLLVFAFLVFLTATGFLWMFYSGGSYSSALGLPLNVVLYGALPVTSLLGCYYSVRLILQFINRRKEGSPE